MLRIIGLLVMFPSLLFAWQIDSVDYVSKPSKNMLYIDCYYGFSTQKINSKPDYLYNHTRFNQLDMNNFILKHSNRISNIRYNIGVQGGDYRRKNLSSELYPFNYLYEANVGFPLSQKYDVWVDLGLFPSHIGFESVIGFDNWTVTRSIIADNTPYYETGIKVTANSEDKKWSASLLALNSWQRISIQDNITQPSFGTALSYQPHNKWKFAMNTFVGSLANPNGLNTIIYRTFVNVYSQYDIHKNLSLFLGYDHARDGASNQDFYQNSYWDSWLLKTRIKISNKHFCAIRLEKINDPNRLLITSYTQPFQVSGAGINYDYFISKRAMFRMEARGLYSATPIFKDKDNHSHKTLSFFTNSLQYKLE